MSKCLLCTIAVMLATLLCFSTAVAGEIPAQKTSPLTLLVFNLPPFYVLKQGQPAGGFLLDATLAALDQADIAYTVKEMPPSRILATFKMHTLIACSIGWLKTPERELLARFSIPFYVNKPVALAVPVHTPIHMDKASLSLEALLHAGLTIGIREGFSYGQALDQALEQSDPAHIKHFSDTKHMLDLLAHTRLDAVLITPEEMAWSIAEEPELDDAIRLIPLVDAPEGQPRHIMCDDSVPPAVMERIDAAIAHYQGTIGTPPPGNGHSSARSRSSAWDVSRP